MTDARQAILDRIRQQLPAQSLDVATAYAAIPRTYTRAGSLNHDAVVDLLVDRLIDYDSEVIRTDVAGIPGAVAQLLAKAGETTLVIPPALSWDWLPNGLIILQDAPPLADSAIETAQAVLTPCEIAVAASGTIFLRHGAEQGRRVISLLPDHHLCVVREDQVVETVPEAFARIGATSQNGELASGSAPITTISGPSATSDIEMTRIKGVHGPRRLSVILVHS